MANINGEVVLVLGVTDCFLLFFFKIFFYFFFDFLLFFFDFLIFLFNFLLFSFFYQSISIILYFYIKKIIKVNVTKKIN
jgi:hypothetical protein